MTRKPIKRIHLKPKEQEAAMQAMELLRERAENDPERSGLVMIEYRRGRFQVYEGRPTLFVE